MRARVISIAVAAATLLVTSAVLAQQTSTNREMKPVAGKMALDLGVIAEETCPKQKTDDDKAACKADVALGMTYIAGALLYESMGDVLVSHGEIQSARFFEVKRNLLDYAKKSDVQHKKTIQRWRVLPH